MFERLWEPAKWALKSGIGLGVNLALLTVWVDYLGIWPELAIGINWALLSVYGYLMADNFVFSGDDSPESLRAHARRYLELQGVMAGSKVANYAIYVGLIWVGIDYRISWAVGAVVVFVASFGGSKALWSRQLDVY